jgi:hypothetical protein
VFKNIIKYIYHKLSYMNKYIYKNVHTDNIIKGAKSIFKSLEQKPVVTKSYEILQYGYPESRCNKV